MFLYLPLGRALDDGSMAQVPAAPPPPLAITDLDWHFTIAHACIATALDVQCAFWTAAQLRNRQPAT